MLTAFPKQSSMINTDDNNDENNFPMKIGNKTSPTRTIVMSAEVFTCNISYEMFSRRHKNLPEEEYHPLFTHIGH